jgi:hypothetical protein
VEEEKKDSNEIAINKRVLTVMGIVFALGVVFGVGYLVLGRGIEPVVSVASNSVPPALVTSPTAMPTEAADPLPTQSSANVPTAHLVQPVSAEEMFSEFICPCCGKLIGDCTCGMAAERRGFITGLASTGINKLEIYLAYADRYGLDTFASEEVKKEVREYKLDNAPEERPQIVLEPQKVDLGSVSPKEGNVETSVIIKNTGQKDLIVNNLSTSCGCTTVSVVKDDQEGPVFGTGTPPEGWSATIRPGETAELRIYYDPNFHQDARGLVIREVYVSSNDPIDPVIKARVELNQVD